MDSIEIEQSKKTKQTLSVSHEHKNLKISNNLLDKMIEDNACRKHTILWYFGLMLLHASWRIVYCLV